MRAAGWKGALKARPQGHAAARHLLPHGAALPGPGWRPALWRSDGPHRSKPNERPRHGYRVPASASCRLCGSYHPGHHTRGYYEAEDLPRLAGPSDATTRLQPDFDEATGQVHLTCLPIFSR